jgi:hypothetical protein
MDATAAALVARQRKEECAPLYACAGAARLRSVTMMLTLTPHNAKRKTQNANSFVSGVAGSSAPECALLCAAFPAGLALRLALTHAGAPRHGARGAALDFCTLALPTLTVRLRFAKAKSEKRFCDMQHTRCHCMLLLLLLVHLPRHSCACVCARAGNAAPGRRAQAALAAPRRRWRRRRALSRRCAARRRRAAAPPQVAARAVRAAVQRARGARARVRGLLPRSGHAHNVRRHSRGRFPSFSAPPGQESDVWLRIYGPRPRLLRLRARCAPRREGRAWREHLH